MRTYYIVMVTYHSYYDEVNGLEGRKVPEGIFESLEEAEYFIKYQTEHIDESEYECYYKIHSVELNVEE